MPNFEQANKEISHEAASWLAQIDNNELSTEDKFALAEWVNRSPAHAAELRNLSALWGAVDHAIDEAIAQSDWVKTGSIRFLANSFRSRPAYVFGIVAALFISALFLMPLVGKDHSSDQQQYISPISPDVSSAKLVYNVGKGERLMRTLQDGSVIHLNTDSVIEVNYSDEYRQLNLIRGEALFDVRKDPMRPFQVLAKGKIAEAVGTKFIVRIDSDDVAVTVTEGRVKLDVLTLERSRSSYSAPKASSSGKVLFLDAGQSASVIENTFKVAKLEPIALEQKTAWLDDEFVFAGESLAHVVSEISRYNDVDISIAIELRDTPIGGRFKTTDVDRIIEALQLSESIEVKRSADGAIYLSQ